MINIYNKYSFSVLCRFWCFIFMFCWLIVLERRKNDPKGEELIREIKNGLCHNIHQLTFTVA